MALAIFLFLCFALVVGGTIFLIYSAIHAPFMDEQGRLTDENGVPLESGREAE